MESLNVSVAAALFSSRRAASGRRPDVHAVHRRRLQRAAHVLPRAASRSSSRVATGWPIASPACSACRGAKSCWCSMARQAPLRVHSPPGRRHGGLLRRRAIHRRHPHRRRIAERPADVAVWSSADQEVQRTATKAGVRRMTPHELGLELRSARGLIFARSQVECPQHLRIKLTLRLYASWNG